MNYIIGACTNTICVICDFCGVIEYFVPQMTQKTQI